MIRLASWQGAGAWFDAAALTGVFVAGSWLGATYLSANGVRSMVEWEIGPAAMIACGRGFAMPAETGEAAAAFFGRQKPTLDCSDLQDTGTSPAPPIAHGERYGIWLAAQVFRLGGVSWRSVDVYCGALFGTAMALAWAVFRLAAGRALATAGVMSLAWSNQLPALASFRDYGKQPAFYALFLALGWLLSRALSGGDRRTYGVAAVTGLLVGVGLGFRVDVLVFVPAILAVIAFTPERWTWPALRDRAGVAAVFLAATLISGAPILASMSQGSNSSHVAVLGLMPSFNRTLGLEPSRYDIGDAYDDLYANLVISSHARIVGGDGERPAYGSAAYDRAGSRLLAELSAWFPADVLVRTMGATAQVMRYPFDGYARGSHRTVDPFNQQRWFAKAGEWRDRLLAPIEGREIALVMVVLLLLFWRNWKLGLAATALVWYFCGYSMLQFSRRHTFHLDLIPIGVALVAARLGAEILVQAARDPRGAWRFLRAGAWPRGRVAALAVVAVTSVAGGSLLGLRWLQHRQVGAAIDQTLNGPWQEWPFVRELSGSHELWRLPDPPSAPGGAQTAYIRVDLGMPCAGAIVDLTFVYAGASALSRVFHVPVAPGDASTVMAPVFYQQGPDAVRFVGIAAPSWQAACIQRVHHAPDLRALPLPLMQFVLPPRWREQPLYQRLESPPTYTAAGTRTFLTHPPLTGGED